MHGDGHRGREIQWVSWKMRCLVKILEAECFGALLAHTYTLNATMKVKKQKLGRWRSKEVINATLQHAGPVHLRRGCQLKVNPLVCLKT